MARADSISEFIINRFSEQNYIEIPKNCYGLVLVVFLQTKEKILRKIHSNVCNTAGNTPNKGSAFWNNRRDPGFSEKACNQLPFELTAIKMHQYIFNYLEECNIYLTNNNEVNVRVAINSLDKNNFNRYKDTIYAQIRSFLKTSGIKLNKDSFLYIFDVIDQIIKIEDIENVDIFEKLKEYFCNPCVVIPRLVRKGIDESIQLEQKARR